MKLFLLRHGKAEDAGPGMRDRDRRLTPEGIESMKQELPGIRKMVKSLDYIFTSPYPRASETAAIAASLFGLEKKATEFEALCTSDAETIVEKKLMTLPEDSRVMMVGHSPLLDELAYYFTGPGCNVMLKKGGLCKISFSGKPAKNSGVLKWELKPRELKAGGR